MTSSRIVARWGRDWPRSLPRRSPSEQAELLDRARIAIVRLQERARAVGEPGHALHRRELFATPDAELRIVDLLPPEVALGPFRPGATWRAAVRFSSAFPGARSDGVADQRGVAVRIADGPRRLDLLATTGEAHHARDAPAMIASLEAAAAASAGGPLGRVGAALTLVRRLGVRDGVRMTRTLLRAAESGVSLAATTFYSRAPFQLGDFAVRYRIRGVAPDSALRAAGDRCLTGDLSTRLREAECSWTLELQGFLDPARTPMDDHRIPWDSPWLEVGRLSLRTGSGPRPLAADGFRATPEWTDEGGPVLEPLGDLNRLREAAYAASRSGRARSG